MSWLEGEEVKDGEDLGDLHTHTIFSDGIDTPSDIIKFARFRGLKVVAITDHDTAKGVRQILRSGTPKDIVVVPGVEITARGCHVLALGVTENPSFKSRPSPPEAIEWCRSLGGVAILAHPFGRYGFLPYPVTRRIDIVSTFDGVEVLNGRTLMRGNVKAQDLALQLGKPITGGSDAHRANEVGYVVTVFKDPVESVDDVLTCIKKRRTLVRGRTSLVRILGNVIAKRFRLRYRI